MSEKITNLDPNSSQSYEAHDPGDGFSGFDNIENQQQAELNWVLFQNKGPGPTFIPNPAWVEHKQQKRDQSKQNIKDIWAEHTNFVKNSGFRNPTHPTKMYPQFFADEERNLRLAQILCIPIVKLRDLNYAQRLDEWAINVITVFGDTVSERHYRNWPTEGPLPYNGPKDRDHNLDKIRARVFFTDLHYLALKMANGRGFVENLLHTVWNKQDEGIGGLEEEDYNKSALTECYMFSANECMKEDKLSEKIAIWAKPGERTINRLSDQFRLYTVSKNNRGNIPRHIEVSYVFNHEKFQLIPENGTIIKRSNKGTAHTNSNNPEATGQSGDEGNKEGGTTYPPHTPFISRKGSPKTSPSNLATPGLAKPLDLSELLSGSKGGAPNFNGLFNENEAFRKLFNEKVEKSVKEAMKEEKLRNSSEADKRKSRDVYDPWDTKKDTIHRSSSRFDNESDGLMNALCAKDAAAITLENLAPSTITLGETRRSTSKLNTSLSSGIA